MPALLIRTSSWPNSSTATLIKARTLSRSAVSTRTPIARPPAAWISLAASSACSTVREQVTTAAPAAASPRAIVRPRPRPEPVTIATLSVRSNSGSGTTPPCASPENVRVSIRTRRSGCIPKFSTDRNAYGGSRVAQDLPDSAEVVVLGGGVIGTSIAFHLAEAGVHDVLLLERDGLGEGSTSKAAGGVRAQFADATNIALAAHSLKAFESFGQRPGYEIDLHQVGYLFLLSRPEDVAAFEQAIALQNELGVPSRLIDIDEALRLSPLVRGDGLLAAAFSPSDGHCTPESVVQGYAQGARRHGARLVTRCAAR